MKKVLELLAELTTMLGGKIKKGEIPICSANGISFPESEPNALSYEKAKQVIENYEAFEKESRRYREDKSKIVLPKVLFLHFLKTSGVSLFLFQHITETGWTRLPFGGKVEKALERSGSFLEALTRDVLLTIIGIVVPYICWFKPSVLPTYDSNDRVIQITVGILVVAGVFLLRSIFVGFKERRSIFSAREKFSYTPLYDITRFEYTDGKGGSSEFFSYNTLLRFFSEQSFSSIAAQAARFGGTMGYVVSTMHPIVPSISSVQEKKIEIEYKGKVLPIILLNHSIIIQSEEAEDFYNDFPYRYEENHIRPYFSNNEGFSLLLPV